MNKIKELRKQLGLTQIEIARALNISRRTLQNYEAEEAEDSTITRKYLHDKIMELLVVDESHGFATLKQIKAAAQKVFSQHVEVQCAYLFGSYARGEQTIKSDIDILVVIEGTMGLDFYGMAADLQDILKKNIDLVTLKQVVGSEEFLKRLLFDGILLYKQKEK